MVHVEVECVELEVWDVDQHQSWLVARAVELPSECVFLCGKASMMTLLLRRTKEELS